MPDRKERKGETMTVHSIDSILWKTKLDRISELSKNNQEIVFNNLGHLINMEILVETYHEADGRKAVGLDGMTKEKYGLGLRTRLSELIKKIRKGSYKPQTARIVEIEKEDGSKRPLAISCFEDKLVQAVVSKILTAIYEPIFMPVSFGFRNNHSCHDALRRLMKEANKCKNGAVVEIDIRKCFNRIPHKEMYEILSKKISDKRFLGLVSTIMRTRTLENGKEQDNRVGCPQGSIVSPVLANIYLHTVIDEWFEYLRKEYFRKYCGMVRYADDMVFVFESMEEAKKFYNVLPKRLNKFGLEMNEEKSQLLRSGELAAHEASVKKETLGVYNFLGFTCYWGKSRNGRWRLKYKSRRDRFTKTVKKIKEYLRKNLNTSNTGIILTKVNQMVLGWSNYHSISDNYRRVSNMKMIVRRLLYQWYNRKGGRKRMTWAHLQVILDRARFPKYTKIVSMFI